MLFHLAKPNDDDHFSSCEAYIRAAFWPEEKYVPGGFRPDIQLFSQDVDTMYDIFNKELARYVSEICREKFYVVMGGDSETRPIEYLDLPFLDRYHRFFLRRRWNAGPTSWAVADRDDLFRLHPSQNNQRRAYWNYSKNYGNYNHFLNVVNATARLIQCFSGNRNISRFLSDVDCGYNHNGSFLNDASLGYFEEDGNGGDDLDKLRVMILMFAAFYHDLGKTIVDVRHGMEGAIILSDHTSHCWYQLKKIADSYISKPLFDRDDLYFISDILSYHDLFGTLSTGESGYLRLVKVLGRIRRYAIRKSDKGSLVAIWSHRSLFDLWILNIADIMTSIRDKYIYQIEFLSQNGASARIEEFFCMSKARSLVHDLRVALRLCDQHVTGEHSDDLAILSENALAAARRHVFSRIQRLIGESLLLALPQTESADGEGESYVNSIKKLVMRYEEFDRFGDVERGNLDNCLSCFVPALRERVARSEILKSAIARAIESTGDLREFCRRFPYIGHMDYALGFFMRIAERALFLVFLELSSEYGSRNKPTNWIRTVNAEPLGSDEDENAQRCLWEVQAGCFIDNYVSVCIQILSYLVFRDDTFRNLFNLEFSDAKERLTKEKIDSIIYIDGPSRSRRTTELILQTIFFW